MYEEEEEHHHHYQKRVPERHAEGPGNETIISSPELFKFAARVHFMPRLFFS